jgi:hypothetical protein
MGSFGMLAARAQSADDIALSVRAGSNGSVSCFEADALRQRIAHYGATDLQRARELRLELDVEAPYSAELRVYRAGELVARRHFDNLPTSCADRRDAVALSIALALDGVIRELAQERAPNASASTPDAPSRQDDPAQASVVPREPVGRVVKPKSADTETPSLARAPQDSALDADADPARRAHVRGPIVELHAGGRWLAEALPAPLWLGALGVEVWLNRTIAIDGAAIASTLASSTLAGAGARTRLTGGELLGCSVLRFGRFATEGCFGAIAGACDAYGEAYPVRFPRATLPWVATTARVALRWPDESRVSLRFVLQGHVTIVRPGLEVDGSSERLDPAWLGGSAGLDVLVSLQ